MSILRLLLILVPTAAAMAQFAPSSLRLAGNLDDAAAPEPRLASNVIIDILPSSNPEVLWLGTGGGVTRMSADANQPLGFRFESYGQAQGLGKGGVSGLLVADSIIWSSFAFDTSVGISGAGGGLAYSRDGGTTWTWLPQPRDRIYDLDQTTGYDRVLGYWPTTTSVDNITYDLALSDSFVWIVSKGGGLRKHAFAADYTDYNDTTGWKVVSPDTFRFHPGEILNHRAFSVLYAEGALFVGTAGGINKSTDNGRTWLNISAGGGGISGNFVTALAYQASEHAIWAATWRAEGGNEFYAVSRSTDGGTTWTVHLDSAQVTRALGHTDIVRAHGFGFDGRTVYVCDDLGLWKSPDGGEVWDLWDESDIRQAGTQYCFYYPGIYSAFVESSGRLWVGGVDGLAMSVNNGLAWTVMQTARPLGDRERPGDAYAYPNPWSPQRFGWIRFRYATSGGAVKITIYDFAMSKVAELPVVTRPAGEQYEVWDGRKDGSIVANGTYFYKIEKPGGEVWGKLVVLD
jgi:hypothetical protein